MEQQKKSQCHTCLGTLEHPRNLSDVNYKKLLELLHRLLDLEAQLNINPIMICANCEGKLIWISEFKESCLKSIHTLRNNICKEEFLNDEFAPNNNFDCIAEYSDSDSDFNDSLSTLRKKQETRKIKLSEKRKPKPTRQKSTKHRQYPVNDVLQAIADCRSVFKEDKKRTCLHCDYVGSTAQMLSIHMHKNHGDFATNWCNRCNIQTENLVDHNDNTKCSENRCKFCNKKNGTIHKLTVHLQTHCRSSKCEENSDGNSHNSLQESELTLEFKGENDSSTLVPNNQHSYEKYGPTKKYIKKGRLQQFPHEDVVRAIKETMRSFHTNRECILCKATAKNAMVLSLHMTRFHKDTKDKWCVRCNIMVDDLLNHKKSHSDDILKCSFCEHGFKSIAHLKEHLRGHSRSFGLKIDSTWFCCKHCPKSFPDKQELREHKCRPCRSKRKRSKRIIEDSESDSDDVKFGRGSRRSHLKQFPPEDVQIAINESMKSFHENRKCLICGFLGSNLRTLSTHMSKFHKKLIYKWCTRCNTLVDSLDDHKETHKNDMLKCKFCEKIFNRTMNLKAHLKCHSNSYALDTEPKWFSCQKCPSTYPTEQQLKGHECNGPDPQTFTRKLSRPKICAICKKSVLNIKIHMKQKHNANVGPSKKLCSICGKTFIRSYDLAIHIRTHTGELPYNCSFCEKRFNIRRSLLVHERRHLGEKRHVCSVCGKAFVTSVELKRHSETHESGSEQCSICDKKFSGPASLKLHMKKHRGFHPPRTTADVQEAPPQPPMEVATLIRNPTDPFQQFFADMC